MTNSGFLSKLRARLVQEKSVRLVAGASALTAELLLLFRVILADGEIHDHEIAMLKRICQDEFGLDPDTMDGVYQYLHDFAYETSAEHASNLFAELPVERRQNLLNHMIAIAESDSELSKTELKLLESTADKLGFDLSNSARS